jgi:hypothetical protein
MLLNLLSKKKEDAVETLRCRRHDAHPSASSKSWPGNNQRIFHGELEMLR